MRTDGHIGEAITLNRKRLGLSRLQFATMLGIHYTQMRKYEQGESSVPVDRLVRMADALDMSVAEFVSAGKVDPDELRLLRLFRRIDDKSSRDRVIDLAAEMAEPVKQSHTKKTTSSAK